MTGIAKSYRLLLGDMLYLENSTRPDLTFITGKLVEAIQKPTLRHWCALKDTVRYLIQTLHTGIIYKANQRRPSTIALLIGYEDARLASDALHRKSTSGFLLT